MKVRFTIAYMAMGLMVMSASAQSIKYPKEVAEIYKRADKEAVLTTSPKPIIGVATTKNSLDDVANIQNNGGIALIIPSTTDASALRDIATQLDGMVMDEVTASNEYSVLLNKVASDRNMPILAPSNELMAKIDSGLWRVHDYCKDVKTLMNRASLYKRAKALHSKMISLDTHADLPERYVKGYSVGLRKTNQVSIQKMQEGMLDGEFLVDFLGDGAKTPEELDIAEQKAKKLLDDIYVDMEPYKDFCGIATTPEEALQLKAEGKKALFIALENGAGIGNNLKNVKYYADKGVSYITLTWMRDNALCSSSSTRYETNDPSKGLTAYGKKVVKEMNKQGIMVDCSHCSEQTFWDCIKLSKAPIICSHSGCMANFTHDRNITDEQLRALAKKGGVVQIYAVWNFQGPGKYTTTIQHMVNDIDHAVKVAGINHVGIGADFDGGGGYTGMMAENDAINITMELMKKGYRDEEIAKIWGGNILRVLGEVKRMAKK